MLTNQQKLAGEALSALAMTDDRACENKLVGLLDYDKFDLIKMLIINRAKIFYCIRLGRAQARSKDRKFEQRCLPT